MCTCILSSWCASYNQISKKKLALHTHVLDYCKGYMYVCNVHCWKQNDSQYSISYVQSMKFKLTSSSLFQSFNEVCWSIVQTLLGAKQKMGNSLNRHFLVKIAMHQQWTKWWTNNYLRTFTIKIGVQECSVNNEISLITCIGVCVGSRGGSRIWKKGFFINMRANFSWSYPTTPTLQYKL